jgi:hypothetical protein
MRLQVDGLDAAETRFKHLWGRYVIGFKPATHCARSFEYRVAAPVKPDMIDGSYDLDDSYELFFLCGVGVRELHNTNVHLAVRPKAGSVAAIGSVYGVRFTIQDAQAIPIKHPALLESPPRGLDSLEEGHLRCKNFQFGYQMFDVDEVGEAVTGIVVKKLRHGTPLRRGN